jgi:hypothetical protein
MNRFTKFVVTVLAAAFFFLPGPEALAQKPGAGSVSMLCKTTLGGAGFVTVTFTNLTKSIIPKGQTLFAKKSNETIKFTAPEAVPENGKASFPTQVKAFQAEGDCEGWY